MYFFQVDEWRHMDYSHTNHILRSGPSRTSVEATVSNRNM